MGSAGDKDGEQHDVHVCDAVKATVGRGDGEKISVYGLYIVAVPLGKHALQCLEAFLVALKREQLATTKSEAPCAGE